MKISYFQKNKNKDIKWDNITRDERFFCFELYQSLKDDQKGLLTLIKEGINMEKYKEGRITNQNRLDFLEGIESKTFDIGVEVCFYRDLLKWNGKGIKKTNLPQKRTFDLALFSEDAIIIIEAKAQQGFDTKQLDSFNKDREDIKYLFTKFFGRKTAPKVFIVGLHSSRYTPSSITKPYFDSSIQWDKIAEKYPDSKDLFNRANEIYPNKKERL